MPVERPFAYNGHRFLTAPTEHRSGCWRAQRYSSAARSCSSWVCRPQRSNRGCRAQITYCLNFQKELPHMARKWSNLNIPGALHFVTGNFLNRLPVFTDPNCCTSFLEMLSALNRDWPSKLITYVLMPDHFHLIVNPRDGKIKEFTGHLKAISAKSDCSSKHFNSPLLKKKIKLGISKINYNNQST